MPARRGPSFETPASGGPQDEVLLVATSWTLMVRSPPQRASRTMQAETRPQTEDTWPHC